MVEVVTRIKTAQLIVSFNQNNTIRQRTIRPRPVEIAESTSPPALRGRRGCHATSNQIQSYDKSPRCHSADPPATNAARGWFRKTLFSKPCPRDDRRG